MIDRLAKLGLVEQRDGRADRRRCCLYLTPKAVDRMTGVAGRARAALVRFVAISLLLLMRKAEPQG